MVLTRDIAECRQIYNNYGNLNNQKLVSTYGFFDPDCQTDFVSVHKELFYNTTSVNVPKGAAQFWKDHGYETVKRLVAENEWAQAKWNEMETVRDAHSATTGEEFIHWSLSLTNKGPTITCLVWGFLCVLFDEKRTYEDNVDVSIRAISQLCQESLPPDFDCPTLTLVSQLFHRGVEERHRAYISTVQSLKSLKATMREATCLETPDHNKEELMKLKQKLGRLYLVGMILLREGCIVKEFLDWFVRMSNETFSRCKDASHNHKEIRLI
jgi:hypothetical protein